MPKSTKKKKDKAADFTVREVSTSDGLSLTLESRKPSSNLVKANKPQVMLWTLPSKPDVRVFQMLTLHTLPYSHYSYCTTYTEHCA